MQDENKSGQVIHLEMKSLNPQATAKFFADVFGWEMKDMPSPENKSFKTPGGFEGHIHPLSDGEDGPSVTNYILVEDIDAAEEAIIAAGGKIISEHREQTGRRLYTSFETPGGVVMVAWQHANR